MNTICSATGLKIFFQQEWINKKISDTCTNTFSILGGSILYSAPKGNFDFKGIKNSIQLKNEVKKYITGGKGPYFQILDYANLKSSAQAARKIFIKDLDSDKRLQALIFCNLSLPLFTAVKIGKQFITTDKIIHIVNHYEDAIKLAINLSDQFNLKQDYYRLDKSFYIENSSYSRSQVILNLDKDWDIETPEFCNRLTIIDRCILHSISKGYLKYKHLSLIEQLRKKCQKSLPQGSYIKYMITDTSGLEGMCHKSRTNYLKSLKKWHQSYPFRMYIVYGSNTFINTVVHMAKPLMPFKINIARDFYHALEIIRNDKQVDSGKSKKWHQEDNYKESADENIKKMLAFIASLNWEQPGVDRSFIVDQQHPFKILFQSIKLIKEEFDSLLNEQKQLNESLINEIKVRKKAEDALKKSHDKLEQNTVSLKETNIALKVLLDQRELDKSEIEEKILNNVEKLIFPHLEKLKGNLSELEKNAYLEIIESNLKEIISPFSHNLSNSLLKLSPSEIQVADLIRQGKTTKDIAKLLRISTKTVSTHRQNIRKKLVLTNKKINLQTSLQQLNSN